MDENEDLLDSLLAVATEFENNELLNEKEPIFKERDLFQKEFNKNEDKNTMIIKNTVIHNGDTDSSEDEDNRNPANQKYNDCGKEIKKLLGSSVAISTSKPVANTWKTLNPNTELKIDTFMDPIFSMRIINPKISSAMLLEKMQGRVAVKFNDLPKQIMGDQLKNKDWVICGVVIGKSPPKTSQKGSQYSIWSLSDLKGDINKVALFMFSTAHKDLWKTLVGTVIAVLNPRIMEHRGFKELASLSIDTSQKIMILGDSKDFGTCKSMTKTGEKCMATVNLSECEYCIYHIKQEYQKCSKRSELQANFSGKGLTSLRNKVLGKSEVFYAGKSYTAIPPKKNRKLEIRDKNILQNLNCATAAQSIVKITKKKNGVARTLDVNPAERARDLALLKKLGGAQSLEDKTSFNENRSEGVTFEESRAMALDVLNKLKTKQEATKTEIETINKEKLFPKFTATDKRTRDISVFKDGEIDLNKPVTPKHIERAKLDALKYIERYGPIEKVDPNNTKPAGKKKRPLEGQVEQNVAKKTKLQESAFISDRFKKMMAASSINANLAETHYNEEKEKYFNKLETKEKMEEKMINTHKVKCKAVKCLKCRYTSFSASDRCKTERHPLKICRKFNDIGKKLLSRGFIQLEKRHVAIHKKIKQALPRRESERKNHPFARHSDILQSVETRMSMLNMTYMRYIDGQVACFIPGKVLDEIKRILDFLETWATPPRTHQFLQELRDLSSMAVEHFDEHIQPRCKDQLEQRSASLYKQFASTLKQAPRILNQQPFAHPLATDLCVVKKTVKTHKHHIAYLTRCTQKMYSKLRKQNNIIRIQSLRLKEQERKLHEQSLKIAENDSALAEIKKHMDEWEQKYKDRTAELVRARHEILSKTVANSTPQKPEIKSNIKPRSAHILPKNYLNIDLERKRKSSLGCSDVVTPLKRNRVISSHNVSLNIPKLEFFEVAKEPLECKVDERASKKANEIINSFLGDMLNTPSCSLRKRKMNEDINLK